ncbi:MAG: hypothetical protein WAU68_15010 [Vitreimonas sp.]
MDTPDDETWRLTVDARLAALEAAFAAFAILKGREGRHAVAAALETAAASAPPEQDPAYRAAMREALLSLAVSLRTCDKADA